MLTLDAARFAASDFAHTVAVLATAFVLGTAIGFERQWRQRSAGLRTTVLVAIGAAAFSDLGMRLLGATRIVAYVVSGIGFLGAGVILKDGTNIRGLNTAATLWCAAAVGASAGTGMLGEAVALSGFVLACNTLLRPLVNWVNRRQIKADETEAQCRIHAICAPADVPDVRDMLDAELTLANYPVRDVQALSGVSLVELIASVVPITADPAELDAVVPALESSPKVHTATWTAAASN